MTPTVRTNCGLLPESINPRKLENGYVERVAHLIFGGLTRMTSAGEAQPFAATTVDRSTAAEVVIGLRRGWQFTRGLQFTPESVIASASPYAGDGTGAVDGRWSIKDESHIVLSTSESDSTVLMRLATPRHAPYAVDSASERTGLGPYEVEARLNRDSRAVLRLRPHRDQPPRSGAPKLDFVQYADQRDAVADFENGLLEILDLSPGIRLPGAVEAGPAVACSVLLGVSGGVVGLSGRHHNLRRQALSAALDRQALCDGPLAGHAAPSCDFSSRALPDSSELPAFTDDHAHDRALDLWNAGERSAPTSIEIGYNADGGHDGWIRALADQLEAVLPVTIHPRAFKSHRSLRDAVLRGTFKGLFRTGWRYETPTAHEGLTALFSEGGEANDFSYRSDKFDAALIAAAGGDTRKGQYDAPQRILERDMPAIPLWDYRSSIATQPGVSVSSRWNGLPNYEEVSVS